MRCLDLKHRWFVGSDDQKEGDLCPECTTMDENIMKEYKINPNRIKPDVVFFGEKAPMYSQVFAILKSLRKEDFLVISGTSRAVFPVRLFHDTPATLIFNDVISLPEKEGLSSYFVKQFIGPCTKELPFIREFVQSKINSLLN